MADWTMIGVPSSAGAHHAGQERARCARPDCCRGWPPQGSPFTTPGTCRAPCSPLTMTTPAAAAYPLSCGWPTR